MRISKTIPSILPRRTQNRDTYLNITKISQVCAAKPLVLTNCGYTVILPRAKDDNHDVARSKLVSIAKDFVPPVFRLHPSGVSLFPTLQAGFCPANNRARVGPDPRRAIAIR